MWVKNSDELYHRGKKGMKWGYNDGRRNGKRTAGDYDNSAAEKFVEEYGTNFNGLSFRGYENGYAVYVSDEDPNKVMRYKYSFDKETTSEKIETTITKRTADGKKYVEEHVDETVLVGSRDRNMQKAVDFVGSAIDVAIKAGKGLAYLAKEASKKK
jgi:hypothetical protein